MFDVQCSTKRVESILGGRSDSVPEASSVTTVTSDRSFTSDTSDTSVTSNTPGMAVTSGDVLR